MCKFKIGDRVKTVKDYCEWDGEDNSDNYLDSNEYDKTGVVTNISYEVVRDGWYDDDDDGDFPIIAEYWMVTIKLDVPYSSWGDTVSHISCHEYLLTLIEKNIKTSGFAKFVKDRGL